MRSPFFPILCVSFCLSCGLFGLDGDEDLLNLECEDGVPDAGYPSLAVGSIEGFLRPGESEFLCTDDRDRGQDSAEVVYLFTPPKSGVYRVSVFSSFDAVLYRVDSPCDAQMTGSCTDGPAEDATESFFEYFSSGETQLIVVDGFQPYAQGEFTVTVSEGAEEPQEPEDGTPRSCGWDPENSVYACGFEGEDPDGVHPADCTVTHIEGAECSKHLSEVGCCYALLDYNHYCSPSGITIREDCRP